MFFIFTKAFKALHEFPTLLEFIIDIYYLFFIIEIIDMYINL